MPDQPNPNWGNTHHKDCPLTQGRIELWRDFAASIANGPDERRPTNPNTDYDTYRDYLWGAVIEYCAGGDQDLEECRCATHNSPEQLDMIVANGGAVAR